MMRRPLTKLTLVATCGLLAVGAVATVAGVSAGSESSRPQSAKADAATRSWHVNMSPSPSDLALAELSFPGAGGERLTPTALHLAVSGPFGDDYLASAALRAAAPRGPTVLVLLANRPSQLLDPVTVRLQVTSRSSLGAPVIRELANLLTRPGGDPKAAVCGLPRHGAALTGTQLSVLGTRGSALAGFAATGAVAQAYDLACGLPYASSFKQAVQQPAPPVGKIPGEGCVPTAGRACPLAVGGALATITRAGARRVPAGAH